MRLIKSLARKWMPIKLLNCATDQNTPSVLLNCIGQHIPPQTPIHMAHVKTSFKHRPKHISSYTFRLLVYKMYIFHAHVYINDKQKHCMYIYHFTRKVWFMQFSLGTWIVVTLTSNLHLSQGQDDQILLRPGTSIWMLEWSSHKECNEFARVYSCLMRVTFNNCS